MFGTKFAFWQAFIAIWYISDPFLIKQNRSFMSFVSASAKKEKETHDTSVRLSDLAVPGSNIDEQEYITFEGNQRWQMQCGFCAYRRGAWFRNDCCLTVSFKFVIMINAKF